MKQKKDTLPQSSLTRACEVRAKIADILHETQYGKKQVYFLQNRPNKWRALPSIRQFGYKRVDVEWNIVKWRSTVGDERAERSAHFVYGAI